MRTDQGNRSIIVMMGRFTKLTRQIPVAKVTVPHIAAVVLENCIVDHGVLVVVLADDGKRFTVKFFVALCA